VDKQNIYLHLIINYLSHPETNLGKMALLATEKIRENDLFKTFLTNHEGEAIDKTVSRLETEISPKISCTDCGNCCKSLMVNITRPEADAAAAHLGMSSADFDTRFVEKSEDGPLMIMNAIPCHFLENNACSIYEHRFAGCREFPALHLPEVNKRLFTIFMHYDRCPIIFNVMESLKVEMGFDASTMQCNL
jgi:Fe-S-cluster containining protein